MYVQLSTMKLIWSHSLFRLWVRSFGENPIEESHSRDSWSASMNLIEWRMNFSPEMIYSDWESSKWVSNREIFPRIKRFVLRGFVCTVICLQNDIFSHHGQYRRSIARSENKEKVRTFNDHIIPADIYHSGTHQRNEGQTPSLASLYEHTECPT